MAAVPPPASHASRPRTTSATAAEAAAPRALRAGAMTLAVRSPATRNAAGDGRATRSRASNRGCRYDLVVYAGHLDLTVPLVWTVDDALSCECCDAYVERMRSGR